MNQNGMRPISLVGPGIGPQIAPNSLLRRCHTGLHPKGQGGVVSGPARFGRTPRVRGSGLDAPAAMAASTGPARS